MTVIGSAHVVIRGITDKLESDIDRALTPAMTRVGDRASRRLADSMSNGLRNVKFDKTNLDFSDVERNAKQSFDKINRNARFKIQRPDTSQVNDAFADIARAAGSAGGQARNDFISNFGAPELSNLMKRLFYQILFGIPAVGALVGALSSLVSGLFAVASAVGPAVSALAVLPGVIGAVVAGLGSTMLAFGGIGKAFSAGNKAIGGAGGAAAKAANTAARAANRTSDAHEQAAEAIASAYERAAERTVAANEAMARAQERLQDVIYDNAKSLLGAQRELRNAEESLAEAQGRSLRAQQGINAAREEAIDRIKELQFSLEGAAISEGKAVIALERAREKLAEVNELPVNHRLRREAELNYRQAQLDLDQAKKSNQDLAKEQEESSKAGVEGSKEVLDAKQEEIDAAKELRNAEEDLQDARASMAETELKNARDLRDARKEIQDVEKEFIDIQKDLEKSISDANKQLAKTLRDVGLSAGGGGGGAAGGINAFNEAMKNLSPEAQRFVRYLLEVQDHFKALRNEAGKELFPKLEKAIDRLIGGGFLQVLGNGLRIVGGAVGDVAIKIANLSADPFFQGQFARFMESNVVVIGHLGDALVNLIDFFGSLVDAARPFTEEFSAWIATITGNWASNARTNFEGLQTSIANGVEIVKQLGRIFGNLWQSIKDVGEAARPAGQTLLDAFEAATEKLNELTGDSENKEKLKKYFEDVAVNVQAVSSLVAAAALEFAKLGDNPAIAEIATIIENNVLPAISRLLEGAVTNVGPQMAHAFEEIVGIFETLANAGGLEAFVKVIDAIASALNDIANIPGAAPIIGVLAASIGTFKALDVAARAINLRGLADQFLSLKGRVTDFFSTAQTTSKYAGPINNSIKQIGDGMTGLGSAAVVGGGKFGKFGTAISNGFGKLKGFVKTNPVLAIATAIGALVAAFASTEKGQEVIAKLGDVLSKTFGIIMDALQPVFDVLQPALDELVKAFQPLMDVLGTAFADIITALAPPLSELATVLGGALLQVLQALMPLITAVADVFVALLPAVLPLLSPIIALVGALVPLLPPVAELISSLLPPLVSILTAIITPVANLAVALAEALVPAIEWLSEGIEKVAGWITDFINWLTELVGQVASAIDSVGGFAGVWDLVVETWNRVWDGITSFFSGIWDNIVQFVKDGIQKVIDLFFKFHPLGIIIKNWDAIVEFIGNVWNNVVTAVSTGIANVISFLNKWNPINVIRRNWDQIVAFFGQVWDNVVRGIVSMVQRVLGWFTNMVDRIKVIPGRIRAYLELMWDFIQVKAAEIIAKVQAVWNGLITFITGLPGRVTRGLAGLWNGFTNTISTVVSTVQTWFNNLITFVTGLPGRAGKALSGIWNGIWNTVQGAVSTAQSWFNNMVSFVSGIPGRIGRSLSGIWNGVWNTVQGAVGTVQSWFNTLVGWVAGLPGRISSAVSGMWNGIKDGFRSVLNTIIGWWNNFSFSLSIPDNAATSALGLAGKGFTINTPNIPYFAEGGTVSATPGGILGVIGEAGRDERITPLRPSGMSIYEERMLAAMENGGLGSGATIEINVYTQPGHSTEDIVNEVSRRLAFKM